MTEEKKIEIGSLAPDFTLNNQNETNVSLKNIKAKYIVLYFYPKDNTPGCTTEAIEFTNMKEDFGKLETKIIGISPDSCASHQKFIDKNSLDLTLLSDPSHEIIDLYNAWKKKKMYGKEYYGVERSTFLINNDMKIVHIWNKVKVKGHVEDVLNKIIELNN